MKIKKKRRFFHYLGLVNPNEIASLTTFSFDEKYSWGRRGGFYNPDYYLEWGEKSYLVEELCQFVTGKKWNEVIYLSWSW